MGWLQLWYFRGGLKGWREGEKGEVGEGNRGLSGRDREVRGDRG